VKAAAEAAFAFSRRERADCPTGRGGRIGRAPVLESKIASKRA